MPGLIVERITEVLGREAVSISEASPLLAKVQFGSEASLCRWAQFNANGEWAFSCDSGVGLDTNGSGLAVAAEQIHLVIPGPIRTNCWETAFYLAGLTDHEGGGGLPDLLVQQQLEVGKLKRVDSLDQADVVANGCYLKPKAIVHAALRVGYGVVCEYLENLVCVKERCANQLGLSMTPQSIAENPGHVLIERFGASLHEDASMRYAEGRPLNFAMEMGELREHPMFFSLA